MYIEYLERICEHIASHRKKGKHIPPCRKVVTNSAIHATCVHTILGSYIRSTAGGDDASVYTRVKRHTKWVEARRDTHCVLSRGGKEAADRRGCARVGESHHAVWWEWFVHVLKRAQLGEKSRVRSPRAAAERAGQHLRKWREIPTCPNLPRGIERQK